MFIGGKLLLLFVLHQSLVVGVSCCRCVHQHPQKSFCDNDLVMRVRLGYEDGKDFHVFIEEIFKGNILQINVTNGLSAMHLSPFCAMDLTVGEVWIFFGRATEDGSLHSEVCLGDRSKHLSIVLIFSSLAIYYNSGCECKGYGQKPHRIKKPTSEFVIPWLTIPQNVIEIDRKLLEMLCGLSDTSEQ